MTKPATNRRKAVVIATLAIAGCAPAAPEGRLVELTVSAADTTRGARAAAEEEVAPPFQRSSCTREGPLVSLDLGLASRPDVTYASVTPTQVRLWLASGSSSAVFVEAETLGAELEGLVALSSTPLRISRAFEGFGVMRRPADTWRGLVRTTKALPDGRFELTLAPPDGLEVANEDALRVVASCEELSLVDDESGVPRSPNETMTSLIREQVALSKTPGGEPVAFVTEESGCPGSVVVVETKGSSALVRVYLDQLVAYGWVDGSALAPAATSRPPLACGLGMIGILSAGPGPSPDNRAPRHVCKRPIELFARNGSKPVRVGRLTQETCLRVKQGKKEDGFVAVELDGRVSVEVAPKPGVSFLVTEADWAGCEREGRSDGPAWARCD